MKKILKIGDNDCGLFMLTFAASLCYKDGTSLMFYDQISLRDHYVKCIEYNEIQPFPSKPKRGSTIEFPSLSFFLFLLL